MTKDDGAVVVPFDTAADTSKVGVPLIETVRPSPVFRVFAIASMAISVLGGFAFACSSQGVAEPDAPERLGTVRQALTYSNFMNGLAPVAWYKFDESSGTVANDSSGRNHHGTYVAANSTYSDSTAMLGASGAVNDNSTAAHFGTLVSGARAAAPMSGSTYLGQYMTAATASDFSLTKGEDNFNRTASLSPSWGTPSTGAAAWTWIATNGNYYGVSSSTGAYINQQVATGTFGQKFDAQMRLDTDTQVDLSWTNPGNVDTTTGTYQPLLLTARFADANNFYAARITEANGVIKLAIVKKSGGVTTYLDKESDGSDPIKTLQAVYYHGDTWRVRFQIDSDRSVSPPVPKFRAKAWKVGWIQPDWQLVAIDPGTPLAAGGNAIMSSNSGTNNHSTPVFDNYRIQSTGFSVSAWIRPTTETFTNSPPATKLCGAGTQNADLVNFIGKSGWVDNYGHQNEWHLRHYPQTANDSACGPTGDRRGALSAYAFTLSPPAGLSGTGAGDRINPDGGAQTIAWHHVVGVFDPGDYNDLRAGVLIYVDNVSVPKVVTDGGAPGHSNYAHSEYMIDPKAGRSPLRVGAGYGTYWNQFQGDIDELSIYEYRLTPQNVADMYAYKK